jgi:hypothetical protein
VSSVIVEPFRFEVVDLTSISAVSVESIILGEKYARRIPESDFVHSLGDDPDSLPLAGLVGAQESAAVDEGVVVCVAVAFIEVTPIAGDVPGQELTCVLTGFSKGFKGSRRGDDPAKAELLGLVKTHFVS